ncbi:relaxase/mobilization nuclease domain-containing protein [Roseibium sp. MMSF_3544]|uniref:relaxase/mobilization nuclease domain-containing protein n=1 Tax=unclassified Roseibium TaxID=2629323 RepID=UPI0027400AB2|nr:relaxase [Roseibium sp. MMSF_3544]
MILHGNARGGGRALAAHLMKPENERVEIIEMRGFASDNPKDAFAESYAISKGTRCKQHLFSLSINPPARADITDEDYKNAAERVENELELNGQPRAIVRHWKRGDDGVLRQHAYAVWCRIDVEKMKAIPLPFSKLRLREVSRELHIQHKINMPPGLINSKHRDPRNFTLKQSQQCKRSGKNIRQLQSDFRDAWASSNSTAAFANALRERGYILAKGKRGHVAVDFRVEPYAIRIYVGVKPRDVCAKLGFPDQLPDIDAAQIFAAQIIREKLVELRAEQRCAITSNRSYLNIQKKRLLALQAREVSRLEENKFVVL